MMGRDTITGFALALVALLCLGSAAMAQMSVGFADPENIESVLDYRLPSWGYTETSLRFDLRGDGSDAWGRYERETVTGRIMLSPTFRRYHESEENLTFLDLDLDADWSLLKTDENGAGREIERVDVGFGLAAKWDRYFRPERFLITGCDADLSYMEEQDHRYSEKYDQKLTGVIKNYKASAGIGIGIGRVRDVTPLIRALRFNERFKVLGKAGGLCRDDIQSIAGVLATRAGYNAVHDRPGKYFWQDVLDRIADADSLTPFEMYYLAEVLQEDVGTRLQGWDLSFGLTYAEKGGTYYASETWLAGFVAGRLYKNLTLDTQLGIAVYGHYGPEIGSHPEKDSEGEVQLTASYLWLIADRLSWEPGVTADVGFGKVKDESQQTGEWISDQEYVISAPLKYFIEDRIVLSTGASYTIRRLDDMRGSHRSNQWYLQCGVLYHFDRHLH